MRSAEKSGVGVKRFGLAATAPSLPGLIYQRLVRPIRRFAETLSPVSIAIGATAIVAAGLSVTADAAWTLAEAEARERDLMRFASSEPAAAWSSAGMAVAFSRSVDKGAALEGVMQRGVGAFGLALIVSGLVLVRRRRTVPDDAGRQALLDTLPFGAACWTSGGRLIACNAAFRESLALRANGSDAATNYRESVQRLVAGGHTRVVSDDEHSRVLELHRADGSCLMIDERPLAEHGFVTLVSDVTETVRTGDQLTAIREQQRQLARRYHEEKLRAEAASRSKTTFLAHLSHDIRTPLNHIIGFADMMKQQTYGPLGDHRYLGYVESMKDSGERLLQFFGSILELAELENGDKPLAAHAFGIDDMLAAVFRRFAAPAQQTGVALSLGAPCGARLVGDRFALERMVSNIVENAVRYTRAGGRVALAAYAAPDGVVVEITDTGIGIAPERLEALSQPFAFGDAALTRQHSGAGLGIAIARTIAELSGGRLAIDSRPALGTTVAISLPLPRAELSDVRAA